MWKKIVSPVLLVGLLWIGVGGMTTYYILWLQSSLAGALRNSLVAIRSASEMESMLWRMQSSVMEGQQQGRPYFPTDAGEHEMDFERALASLSENARTEREQLVLKNIDEQFSVYRKAAHRWSTDDRPRESLSPASFNETMLLASNVGAPCKDFAALKLQMLMETIDRFGGLTRGVISLRLILFCSGPVIGVLLGLWVTRNFRSSIHQISARLHDATRELEPELGNVQLLPTSDLPALEHQVKGVAERLTQVAGELELSRQGAERTEQLAVAGELAAGIAHELRNPLTSVKLLVQTAAKRQRDRSLTDKQFQVLQEEIARMEESIQSMLDLARPAKLRRHAHNVLDTLRRSLNVVRSRAAHVGVTLLEGLPNARVIVEGDAEQLHQVFVNLLLNGIEAMPESGTLRVSIGGISECDPFCRIKFSDTGAGIPEDMLERLFDPFVSGKESGCGLGLAVSRRIVQAHGGTIIAANRPEGGAVFTVALPFVIVEHGSVQPTETSSRETSGSVKQPTRDLALDGAREAEHVQTTGH